MATSGTYNFVNITIDKLIAQAYRRIGTVPDVVESEKTEAAQISGNLILSDWINRGMNLWTLTPTLISLVPNQNSYLLTTPMNRIIQPNIRTSVRQLGGTAFSSAGGIAANAFDGNYSTACIQTSSNGYISYNYGSGNLITVQMVGVQSNVTRDYTLSFEYSNDNATWITSTEIPTQSYPIGNNQWFVLQVPVPAQYFRVREMGGATLNIQELYFDNTIQDIPIGELSVTEYWSIPQKNQTSKPSSYYLQRNQQPILYLWPTPGPASYINNMNMAFFYIRERLLQDISGLTDQIDTTQRFYPAFVAGLSFELALIYAIDRVDRLKAIYDETLKRAMDEDSQTVPLRIWGDFSSGWTGE